MPHPSDPQVRPGVYALNNTCSGALQINAPMSQSRGNETAKEWSRYLFTHKELLLLETWIPNEEEMARLGGRIECSGNVSTNGGLMLNAPIDASKGIYAPGICREWGPDGGVVVPWTITGGWYACEGGVGAWGFHDMDSEGPCRREPQTSLGYHFHRPQHRTARLCANCAEISIHQLNESPNFEYTLVTDPSTLVASSTTCRFCQWISDFFRQHDSCTQGLSVSTVRVSFLAAQTGQTTQNSVMSESGGSAPFYVGQLQVACGRRQHHAPSVSFHVLHHRGSNEYMRSLSAWLTACDKHNHANVFSSLLPTRVLDLGEKPAIYSDQDLCLLEADGCRGTYIALSHRWGDVQPLRTTRVNLHSHICRIVFDELPRTFQDAVLVTRALGIRYLWIDSLCIIQDDQGDWARESILMEKIFASAYCTISATSSRDSTCGFLARDEDKSIKMQGPSGKSWDVVNFDDDFQRDVENGVLQSRAWVLQERALSRRTLHFTDSQTYLECGSGIFCETTGFVPEQGSVLSSSEFPHPSSDKSKPPAGTALLEELYGTYTSLAISCQVDRPIAIIGLESRLALYYNSPSIYGVLTRRDLFGRTLLWQRWKATDMQPIPSFKKGRVPTWSWMSMAGEISYLPVPEDGTIWKQDFKIALPKSCTYETVRFLLAAPLEKLHPGCEGVIVKETGGDQYTAIWEQPVSRLVGWLRYDDKSSSTLPLKDIAFVTIANGFGAVGSAIAPPRCKVEAEAYSYVLVVLKTTVADLRLSKVYRRLGVGVIAQEFLVANEDLVGVH